MTEYFELGRILKPQGIKGEVKLDAFTDGLSRFLDLEFVYFKKTEYERVDIENARIDARYAYLKLRGIDTRDDAEKLRGTLLYIDRAHAAKLPEGAFYIQDLIGCTVKDDTGNGAADVYVVKLEKGTCMFPAVGHIVLVRDIENGVITVDAQRLTEVAVYDI
jgi:16S rRNA processing protein RimM